MTARKEKCLTCRHFRNDRQYIESVFKGFNVLCSMDASVRKDDGICVVRDQYLSADFWCDQYTPFEQAASGD